MLPDLLEFQRGFADAIGRRAAGALAVYRNTVVHGAVEALRANFPVVDQIVGAEMFDGIAAEYSEAHPPYSAVMALYGERLAEWLEHQDWIGDVPYLPDVARVERLRTECLFAADAEPLSAEALADPIGLDRLHLELHPAARFDWLATPAMSIWIAHQQDLPSQLELDWQPEGALFTRRGRWLVQPVLLDPAAHRLLCGIRLGESLGAATTAAGGLRPDSDPPRLLAFLAELGAFAAPAVERN